MLKGSYTAIIVSVLLHLLLLITLIYGAIDSPKVIKQEQPKVTVIKSFLYAAPKIITVKKVAKKVITTEKIVTEIKPPKKINAQKIAIKKLSDNSQSKLVAKRLLNQPVAIPITMPETTPMNKAPPTQVTNAVKSESVTTINKVAGDNRGNFSSYDRLSRLRKKLDNQQRDQAFAELTQKRSASTMDGEPFPVPKTLVPLTADQQHKLNTSTSHVGSITKNDNGTCTIQREQILGSPVAATTSYFACGESKFDKSFREHMQKVQAKLVIKR